MPFTSPQYQNPFTGNTIRGMPVSSNPQRTGGQFGPTVVDPYTPPTEMKTLVYSPEVRVIVNHSGRQYDLTPDIVKGTIIREENSASSLFLTLANKKQRYSGLLGRMDKIRVEAKRTKWVVVFTGYLDTVPYGQMYPGVVEIKATCTLKRLLHTWWDPGLVASTALLNQFVYTGAGFEVHGDSQASPDTGLGQMLAELLVQVGNWNRADILIQDFPMQFMTFLQSQYAQIESKNRDRVYQFRKLLLGGGDVRGGPGSAAGSYGGGPGGSGGPTSPGAMSTGAAFYLIEIVTAVDMRQMGPMSQDLTNSQQLVTAGEQGLPDRESRTAWTTVGTTGYAWNDQSRRSDAAILAVACATAESTMMNKSNPAIPESANFPNDGPGYDHDSVGLFQQRPGWGSVADRMTPRTSAGMFLDALAKFDWRNMDPGAAIAQVQKGPPASFYTPFIEPAYAQVQAIRVSQGIYPPVAGAPGAGSIPGLSTATGALPGIGSIPGVGSIPGIGSALGGGAGGAVGGGSVRPGKPVPDNEGAVNFALAQIGKPYSQAARTGPGSYDCIAEGTLITTHRGDIPIEKVTTSDLVLTRKGYRKVLRAWKVRDDAELFEIIVNGKALWGTGDHRVWTENRGWIPLKEISSYDTLVSCRRVTSPSDAKRFSSRATLTSGIPIPKDLLTEHISSDLERLSTEQSTNTISAQSLTATKSITSTMTRSTTIPIILNASPSPTIGEKARRTEDYTHIPALSVDKSFGHFAPRPRSADSVVVSTSRSTTTTAVKHRRSVYDLSVEGEHEFFANGVLVHNCSGLMVAAFRSIGIEVPNTTYDYGGATNLVPPGQIQRGDIIISPDWGHAMLSLGGNSIVEAGGQAGGVGTGTLNYDINQCHIYRFSANGGTDPSAPFNAAAITAPGMPVGATDLSGGTMGPGSQQVSEPIARNLFSYQFEPGKFANPIAELYTDEKSFINDQPLIQMVQAVAKAGLRNFQSSPTGQFMAYYPDWFGLDGKQAIVRLEDIECKDVRVNFSDDPLTTHVYVAGDFTGFNQNLGELGWLDSTGVVTVEDQWLFQRLATVAPGNLEDFDAGGIMNRFGARPYALEMPLVGSHALEFLVATHIFMLKWAEQYQTSVQFTFMPELFPGMRIELTKAKLSVYVTKVVHSFDFESGFFTSATIMAPSRLNANAAVTNNTMSPMFSNSNQGTSWWG